MALGPDVPEWLELRGQLLALTESSGAHNSYVLDAWANVWCAARGFDWPGAVGVAQVVVAGLRPALQRGGRVDRALHRREGHGYVRSFAAVYLLLLRFSGPYAVAPVRQAIAEALPRIEALTLALPPPEGPGSGTNEGFGVA